MKKTPTAIAIEALKVAEEARALIIQHETECTNRWKENTTELRGLRHQMSVHASRWEKVAWMLTTAVVGAAVVTVLSNFI